jgi:hypothetical protein
MMREMHGESSGENTATMASGGLPFVQGSLPLWGWGKNKLKKD